MPLFCQTAVWDVCTATNTGKSHTVRLRGTGTIEGSAILFDYSCPAGTGNDFVLPSAVIVEKATFAGSVIAARFKSLTRTSLYQAVIEGRLECAPAFKIEKADDGDIIGANGFGPLTLYRCRMREGRFLLLHVLDP